MIDGPLGPLGIAGFRFDAGRLSVGAPLGEPLWIGPVRNARR